MSTAQIPEGWRLVPVEPTAEMLDVAVSHALMVSLGGDYNWSAYMRDVWGRMLAAAPSFDDDPEPDQELVDIAKERSGEKPVPVDADMLQPAPPVE